MTSTPKYSTLLHCIYDEAEEHGQLGRGTHYSVFRVPEWFDVTGRSVRKALRHDFAVLWDEDHDERIVPVLERLYVNGLLYPVQFIGERKGGITAILASKFYHVTTQSNLESYKSKFAELSGEVDGDWWNTEFGIFDKSLVNGAPHQTDLVGIVNDRAEKVDTYVRNIDNLWSIGSWPFRDA
jgi:hypothetical protein